MKLLRLLTKMGVCAILYPYLWTCIFLARWGVIGDVPPRWVKRTLIWLNEDEE